MWDKFLNKTVHSCYSVNNEFRGYRKTDLFPVESLNGIRKDTFRSAPPTAKYSKFQRKDVSTPKKCYRNPIIGNTIKKEPKINPVPEKKETVEEKFPNDFKQRKHLVLREVKNKPDKSTQNLKKKELQIITEEKGKARNKPKRVELQKEICSVDSIEYLRKTISTALVARVNKHIDQISNLKKSIKHQASNVDVTVNIGVLPCQNEQHRTLAYTDVGQGDLNPNPEQIENELYLAEVETNYCALNKKETTRESIKKPTTAFCTNGSIPPESPKEQTDGTVPTTVNSHKRNILSSIRNNIPKCRYREQLAQFRDSLLKIKTEKTISSSCTILQTNESTTITDGCKTESIGNQMGNSVDVFPVEKAILKNFGERGSGLRSKSEPQDFLEIRDHCLDNGILFEDPEFPTEDSSLFFSKRPDRYYEWKRPHEIVDNPQLFVEGYSRFDVQQGELGDCWLLAAVANLTLYKRLFFQIVPDDQGFDEKYAGVFHFRFWQYGKWIDVVIDDRLPTYRGQLVFLHSTEDNEFWSALLEKAYAKLHGSYEALKGGSTCEAMEDFTGGVTEMYEMDASPPNLFKIIHKAYERSSLMGCSIEPDPNVLEAETPEDLIRGHAYSITRVQYVDISTPNVTGKIPLLRLRNPWGNEAEWNGAWSDGSPEWRYISESEKQSIGLTFDNDGEFWMSFKDFQQYFSRLEICNLNPDSLTEEEIREGNKKQWEMSVYEGEWVRGVSAGGCRNFLDTFWHNPQYRITLTEVDEGDDDNNCTLIIALMQKHRRSIRNTGVEELTIGFAVYHLPYPDRVPKPLDLNFFKYNASVARSPSFINLREVSCRFKLPRGTYCIVPSTFDPNEEGEFLLRVFSENKNNMEVNDNEVEYQQDVIAVAPVPEVPELQQETDEIYQHFLKLAGDDQEVDWLELKEILDHSMKKELQSVTTTQPQKKTANRVNAAPGQTQLGPNNQETGNDLGGMLTGMLSVLCGALCKDTPLAEYIPPPSKDNPLHSVFTDMQTRGFSKDICRSMVAMLDDDHSGKLGYPEFKTLWVLLRKWKDIWYTHDQDRSGSFSGYELRDAFTSAGYRLNIKVLNALMHRYGNKNGEIQFDDFIMCAVKLKSMFDAFKKKDENNSNSANFTIEEWLETTLYT